ncbi:sulfotransferase [Candidatus Pelagibacter sp. Uisw_092]|uniref:sulfotransferase n=1 Tax=Candidatus Pelagibacter sp. Uisw_092 TaxID=3230979 RepID=UPI0039EA32F2
MKSNNISADNAFKKLQTIPLAVISTFGHNGIDWMHSLLDNHQELLIMPAFSFFRSIDRIKLHNRNINFSKKNSINNISGLFSSMFYEDTRNKVQRRNFIKTINDKKNFHKHLKEWLLFSKIENFEKDLFLGIHYAFIKLYKININNKKLIVHQEHVPWHSEKYLKLFNAKFIFMMRDPRAAIAGSILRMQKHNNSEMYPNQFDHVLLYWKYANYFTSKNKHLKNKIIVMKNEKLHQNIKREMKKLSAWLGISFSKTLINQTFLGKKWFGETAYLQGKNQEDDLKKPPPKNYYNSRKIKKRWKSVINKKRILIIEVILSKLMKKYKYKTLHKLTLYNFFLGYFFCFTDFTKQKKYFISKIIIKIRNLLRRFIIIFFPRYAYKTFKIL